MRHAVEPMLSWAANVRLIQSHGLFVFTDGVEEGNGQIWPNFLVWSIFKDSASVEDSAFYSASECLEQALEENSELENDEHFIKARELIVGIQEDGSFKSFMRRPHREVLRLRWLVCRGRATPRRAFTFFASGQAIEFICKQGDNGIVWNILSFWRAST